MKKFLNKIKNYAYVVGAFVVGLLVVGNNAKAAADADLTAGLASTTAIFTDNKGEIITWVVGVFAAVIVMSLVIRALFFSKGMALGIFGGRRKRR